MTNLELKFDVPMGTTVEQAPSRIPPIFNGEKVVMYGLLKSEKSLVGEKCSATLTGDILGEKMEHRLCFEIPSSTPSGSGDAVLFENILHFLAAKRLIQDWQDGNGPVEWTQEDRKAAILKMSLDSGVVSPYTALVTVDEDQQQMVEGALQVWDLTAEAEDYSSSNSTCSEDENDECDELLEFGSNCVPMAMEFTSRQFSEVMEDDEVYDCPVLCEKEMVLEDRLTFDGESVQGTNSHVSKPSGKYSLLSSLLSLQAAEGFWTLSEEFARLVEQPLEKLAGVCPTDCSTDTWATALALVFLERHFMAEKEEWELVAMKSEMWLSTRGGSIEEVKEAAGKIFKAL